MQETNSNSESSYDREHQDTDKKIRIWRYMAILDYLTSNKTKHEKKNIQAARTTYNETDRKKLIGGQSM